MRRNMSFLENEYDDSYDYNDDYLDDEEYVDDEDDDYYADEYNDDRDEYDYDDSYVESDDSNDEYIDEEDSEDEEISDDEPLQNQELEGVTEEELESQFKKGKEGVSKKMYPFMSDEDFELYMSNNENAIKFIKTSEKLNEVQREWLMNDFVERNMNLVYFIANKKIQSKFMIDVKELISAGMLGFSKALAKYDPEQGAKFATFAFRCIDNEIKYGIRVESKHYNNTESANKPRCFDKDGKPMNLEDTIADTKMTPEELSSSISRDNLVRERLNALTPLEKYVMYTRFGLDKSMQSEMTQKEVAAAVQMSQANISKIEKTCLEKLKSVMKDID